MADVDVESLWSRLRRRKVVQWGIAYAAGAWGLLQGLGYVTATFQWPPMLQQFATIGLAIGLPIVLVLSWYHGDRGQQRVSAAEFVIITLLFLLGGGIFWRYDRASGVRAGETAVATSPAAPQAARAPNAVADPTTAAQAAANSIAVLPFVNMSGEPANEYFSDGISEEILNVLARTPDLQVAARTSSFAFKGQQKEIAEIARALKVRMVLEGSVRKQGERVRITAQLIDSASGFHAWSETYDRELKDIFAIQDEIALAIGEKMKVQVAATGSDGSTKPGTTSLEAHDHYLRGLSLWQMRRAAELGQAVGEFERAIAADPGYAAAYGGLALVYAVIADYTTRIPYGEALNRATDAAEMALVLDPLLPEPYAALGSVAASERRRATAQALFRRATALRPSFATAYQWMGQAEASRGNPAAGLVSLERASALDPRSRVVGENHAYVLIELGRYVEARATCERVLSFAPDHQGCHLASGIAELLDGRPQAARRFLTRAAELANPSALPLVKDLVEAFEGRGDRMSLARRLAAFPRDSYLRQGSGNLFSDSDTPALLVRLGAPVIALEYLERVSSEPYHLVDWAMAHTAVDPIRCEPRFQAVAKKLAIDDVRATSLCRSPAAST
jgi:TolB-like protein/tetratricopeptide (TPR) repeat protein